MYNPKKDGIEKSVISVKYTEAKPPVDLLELVHCFWELKTDELLTDDFCLHVLPDACVNVLFNLKNINIAAITARHNTYTELNLGKDFHYVGIQLLPGTWQDNQEEIFNGFVDRPYTGNLPLIKTNNKLVKLNFSNQHLVLSELVRYFVDNKLVVSNTIVTKILANINSIHTVAEMATIACISPRHLQRILKKTTGFSPHNFLKILRFQQSFHKHYTTSYTDQSHFIHSFRKITGGPFDNKFRHFLYF